MNAELSATHHLTMLASGEQPEAGAGTRGVVGQQGGDIALGNKLTHPHRFIDHAAAAVHGNSADGRWQGLQKPRELGCVAGNDLALHGDEYVVVAGIGAAELHGVGGGQAGNGQRAAESEDIEGSLEHRILLCGRPGGCLLRPSGGGRETFRDLDSSGQKIDNSRRRTVMRIVAQESPFLWT